MSHSSFKAACLQMRATMSVAHNMDYIEKMAREAQLSGCKLLLLPENCLMMASESRIQDIAEEPGSGPLQQAMAGIAQKNGLTLVVGSFPLKSTSHPQSITASSLVYDAQGFLVARYDKIHLFEAHLGQGPEQGEYYREADCYTPGKNVVVIQTEVAKLGLSICFDIRFPVFYRHMRDAGAEVFLLPAAFAKTTGQAHWEPLLRARAIENQAWLIAAAQHGSHACGRTTYGDSMIVSPWGEIRARKKAGTGLIITDIDLEFTATCKQKLPTLFKRYPYDVNERTADHHTSC